MQSKACVTSVPKDTNSRFSLSYILILMPWLVLSLLVCSCLHVLASSWRGYGEDGSGGQQIKTKERCVAYICVRVNVFVSDCFWHLKLTNLGSIVQYNALCCATGGKALKKAKKKVSCEHSYHLSLHLHYHMDASPSASCSHSMSCCSGLVSFSVLL